jgi:transcription antitermination factor NusA-like protein
MFPVPFVDGILAILLPIAKHLNLKEAHKYTDRIRALQIKIFEESNKPWSEVIDSKIESLQELLKIEMEAYRNAIMSELTKK